MRGQRTGSKNHLGGQSSWTRDHVSKRKFCRCFAISRILYEKLKEELFEYKPMYWCTGMVGDRGSGLPTDLTILVSLRMLVIGGSGDTIDDVS